MDCFSPNRGRPLTGNFRSDLIGFVGNTSDENAALDKDTISKKLSSLMTLLFALPIYQFH